MRYDDRRAILELVLEQLRVTDTLLQLADPEQVWDEAQSGMKAALEGAEADLIRLAE